MENKMIVKFLQCHIEWENESLNLQRYSQIIQDEIGHCDLLVLPETFHCGFTDTPAHVAQTMDGSVLTWMRQTAMRHQTALAGSVVIAEKGSHVNRLVFVYPDGSITWYDKRHLFRMGNEHHRFSPGNRRMVIQYRGWRILLLVCYDLRFPVWARNLEDYDMMLIVANWPTPRREVWNVLLKARAIENQSYVVAVNRVGNDLLNRYSGDSVILDPRGQALVAAPNDQEVLMGTELDLNALRKFRAKFPAFLDRDGFNVI